MASFCITKPQLLQKYIGSSSSRVAVVWVIAGAIEKPQSIEDFRQGRKEGIQRLPGLDSRNGRSRLYSDPIHRAILRVSATPLIAIRPCSSML